MLGSFKLERRRLGAALFAAALCGAILPGGLASGETEIDSSLGGFHGFSSFETHAQAHVVSLVGYLNAFREENRLVGALSEINGPPANSRNIAAMVQRGGVATFAYGVIGGGGGERGTLPHPPPGEAGAFYPASPLEDTWEGPVTAVFGRGATRTFDGRANAAATDTPTGLSEASTSHMDIPDYVSFHHGSAASHTEPSENGVMAESVSIVRGLTAGPLHIESVTSTASAFVPSRAGDPKGAATTVVEGATVNGTPVSITDRGVLVDKQSSPGSQAQVNAALLGAGFKEVRLLASAVGAGDDKQSVQAFSGTLSFVHYDEKFGASNPQGVSGGGFTVGGAEASVSTKRCAPDCPKAPGTGDLDDPSEFSTPPSANSMADGGAQAGYSAPPSSAAGGVSPGQSTGFGANVAPATVGVRTEAFAGAPLPRQAKSAAAPLPSRGAADFAYGREKQASPSGSQTTAAVPESLAGPAEDRAKVAAHDPKATAKAVILSPKFLRAMSLDEKSADWMRDLYLAGGLAAGLLLIVPRLVRAFV